jgi:phenylalanyl-tRNA synthetase beta chain
VFPVTLAEPVACPRFGSRVIRDVQAGRQSPLWLRERLRRVGINSISPIVDVTNYVMLELGHPLHAYDLAKLKGGITVRKAAAGERITLLDDKEHVLDPEFLVIADESGAVGLAGIMGGRDTAISASTTDVLLEAAHFTPASVAGRSRRLGLFTDAAQRFERGVDPSLAQRALERATMLLLQLVGGSPAPVHVVEAAGDSLGAAAPVTLRRSRLAKLLGVTVPDAEVVKLLGAVAGEVTTTAEGWQVRSPPHRFDLSIEADLIEEVARLRGFDSIAEIHASAPQVAGFASESRVDTDRVLTAFADAGYREVITYSFVDPELQRQLFPDAPVLALSNAISAELSEMRVSLWPGLIQAARENLRRQQPRVRLFEMGQRFAAGAALRDAEGLVSLDEIDTLAGIVSGARWQEQWGSAREVADFYDVKADVMRVLALTGSAADFRFEPAALDCLRPGRAARIFRNATAVGWLGELHPRLTKALALPPTTLVFELDVFLAFEAKPSTFVRISKFPSVRRDLAVVVDESVPLAVVQENVTVSASGLLSELRVFDIYRGPGVDSGRKSIALGLILQDSSRTLTDVDADAVVISVVTRLRDVLSASIRD